MRLRGGRGDRGRGLHIIRSLADEVHLTPIEYEGLLRPAFRQDEWKLIAVGGIIGFLVGELQVLLMLH